MTDAVEPRSVSNEDARGLLIDLVRTPSPSGEEGAAADRLVTFFEAHGRTAHVDGVGNVRAPGADLLLTSHIDTVPGGPAVRTDDGVLHGRGSVDAKGPLCALAVSAVRTGASFAGVVCEETDSRGAKHLIEEREPPTAVINGEPGGWDAITLGYRGYLAGTYTARTGAAHTSRPDPNAVQHAFEWWGRLRETLPSPTGPVFEQITATPTAVTGGRDPTGEVTVELDVEFRVPPSVEAARIKREAEAAARAGTLRWGSPIPPTIQSPRNRVANALRAAIRTEGGEPRHVRKTGTADMNLYAAEWGCPIATYGPGDSELDHTDRERLRLSEFDRSVAVLDRAADRLLV